MPGWDNWVELDPDKRSQEHNTEVELDLNKRSIRTTGVIPGRQRQGRRPCDTLNFVSKIQHTSKREPLNCEEERLRGLRGDPSLWLWSHNLARTPAWSNAACTLPWKAQHTSK